MAVPKTAALPLGDAPTPRQTILALRLRMVEWVSANTPPAPPTASAEGTVDTPSRPSGAGSAHGTRRVGAGRARSGAFVDGASGRSLPVRRAEASPGIGPSRRRAGRPWPGGRRPSGRAISAGIRSSGIMLGPSEGAWSGSSWVSMKTAATPTATAARAMHRGELALAAGGGALPARLLHRVGGVHHHRVAGARHDRQAAHVGDQRVVAEGDAALAEQDALVAGARRSWRRRSPCPRGRGTGPSSR